MGRHWNLPRGDSLQLCTSPRGRGEHPGAAHEGRGSRESLHAHSGPARSREASSKGPWRSLSVGARLRLRRLPQVG